MFTQALGKVLKLFLKLEKLKLIEILHWIQKYANNVQ